MLGIYKVQFVGHYPVGAYAVVVARDRGHALRSFMNKLQEEEPSLVKDNQELTMDDFELIKWESGYVDILANGEY